MQLALVSEIAVRELVSTELAFDAVSRALESVASGEAEIMPVVLAEADPPDAMFGVKTATHLRAGLLGLKVGSYFPANHARGMPNHGSTTLLLDAETGLPRALISAGYLNGLRTAAANAIAVESLARADAKTLGVLGAGHQAEFEVRAVAARRPLESIKIWSRTASSARELCGRLSDLECTVVPVASAREAVDEMGIITTVTPSRTALLSSAWVAPGTHISAMGADAPGKQELDPELMRQALALADLPQQSQRVGEFQHALAQGILDPANVIALGDVLLGRHPGRENPKQITVFDSSGVAPQDLHVAAAVLELALERGLATLVEF
jgi:ornithine cyclodeaminase